jgi:hypothetical protein
MGVPPPRRRLTVLDAVALVAATAFGLAWGQAAWPSLADGWFIPPRGGWSMLAALAAVPHALLMTFSLLVSFTLCLLPLRLIRPRPHPRRLPLQPGTAACVAAAIALVLEGVSLLADYVSYVQLRGNSWTDFVEEKPFGAFVYLKLASEAAPAAGGAILSAWAILWLGRRCRTAPDWVEWAGRIVGILWLVTAVCWWAAATRIVEDAAGRLGHPLETHGGPGMRMGGGPLS